MTCSQFRNFYSDFADGLLDEAGEIPFHQHLHRCGACRRFHQAFRAGLDVLQDLTPVRASDDFDLRLLERIERECEGATAAATFGRRQLASLAVALCVVVGAGVIGWQARVRESLTAESADARPRPRALKRTPLGSGVARYAHDTTWGRDPFRVVPTRSDDPSKMPNAVEISTDWIFP